MKLLCAEYNEAGEVAYNVIGDNALLRNNDDFYIPAFATELSCVPQIVLRIGKIGKHVAERFAERYYEEVGVGIRFYADNLERELLAASLSPAAAMAFDSSAAISPNPRSNTTLMRSFLVQERKSPIRLLPRSRPRSMNRSSLR